MINDWGPRPLWLARPRRLALRLWLARPLWPARPFWPARPLWLARPFWPARPLWLLWRREVTAPPSGPQRQRLRTPANLWRALIPLVALVIVAVLLAWPRGVASDGEQVVDVSTPIAAAKRQAGFTVLSPIGLSSGWRPTHVDLHQADAQSAASLLIGYVSPAGHYAELFQTGDAPDSAAAQYGPLTRSVSVTVRGRAWDGFRTARDRQLLRHTFTATTIIVTGSATQAELVELASSVG